MYLCVVSIISCLLLCRIHSTDGPTRGNWSILVLFWVGATGVLRSTNSISGLLQVLAVLYCCGYCLFSPSIWGFDTAGAACTRVSVLLILPVPALFGPSLLLILPPPVLQYSQYPEYNMCSILPSILGVWSCLLYTSPSPRD